METGLHAKQISLQIRVLLFSLLNFPIFQLNPGVRYLVFCKNSNWFHGKNIFLHKHSRFCPSQIFRID